jgi:hypothetical protein
MPWLLLDMSMDREVREVDLGNGEYRIEPGQAVNAKLKLIDTTKGQVTEVSYQINGGHLTERAPTDSEIAAADVALSKRVRQMQADKINRLEEDGQKARDRIWDLENRVEKQKRTIDALRAAAKFELGLSGSQQNLVTAALLMLVEHFEDEGVESGAAEARDLYEKLTGMPVSA